MWNLILLALWTIFLFIWLRKILYESFARHKENYGRIKAEYDKLFSENAGLKQVNRNLQDALEKIIALYDITKQICKSLEADKIFDYFREEIDKYVEVSDCKFLQGNADLSPYKEYTILPIRIQRNPIGYLVADGLSEQDKGKFYILSQQFILGIKRAILYQNVQELAITDSLTGIFNRRYYLERFNEEIERSKRLGYVFSCLMVDIDYFKDYNDRYGHLVGDAILRKVSETIKENIRQIDLMGRYGGEEFSIILSETDKEAAKLAAERIRQAIEYKSMRVYDEELKITISIGISIFPHDGKDADTLIDYADSALYRAKETGRNRVVAYEGFKTRS